MEKELNRLLQLKLHAQMMIEPQASGNCSWANLEAVIPAALMLLSDDLNNYPDGIIDYQNDAIQFYRIWREWNRRRALDFCLQTFENSDAKRKASLIAMFANIVFQRLDARKKEDVELAERLVPLIQTPGYDYILRSWRTYYSVRKKTKAGKNLEQLLLLAGVEGL